MELFVKVIDGEQEVMNKLKECRIETSQSVGPEVRKEGSKILSLSWTRTFPGQINW